jgi:hypothetical protein
MAKLKARGREEIFRVTKVETGGTREGIKGVRHYRALASDGNILERLVIEYTAVEKAKNYGKGSHDYGWKIRGRAKAGWSLEQLLKGYLDKGWELISASPTYFTVSGTSIEAHSQEPFIAVEKAEKRKASLTKQRTRAEEERRSKAAEEDGPGFYVTNGYTGGSMFRTRIADHKKPFKTIEAAVDAAENRLHHLTVDFSFHYLLPVAVLESNSRQEAEQNVGHVWWIDGAFKGPPVDPRQTGFRF